MPNLMRELLGAPEPEPIVSKRPNLHVVEPSQGADVPKAEIALTHDVKRIRIAEHSGRLLLSMNRPAARDLLSTQEFPNFLSYLDGLGQELVILRSHEMADAFRRPREMVDGLFDDKQAVLVPKKLEDGERGPDLSDEQIVDFARKCVDGEIVRRWAVPEAEAAQKGVIVCDNRRVLPESPTDTGPLNSDVIASSLAHYEPR